MRYNLVIIGGGVVGASLAVALKKLNLQIALIDARLPSSQDSRLFGLNYSSCEFLKNIGIWSELSEDAFPIHEVHVSKQGQFGGVRLHREDLQLSSLGHVIKASTVEQVLNDQLEKQTNLHLCRPAELIDLTIMSDGVQLHLKTSEGNRDIEADMVIGADGTHSSVRKLMQIESTQFDYQQQAIVTQTLLQRSHQQIAYERFTKEGAIAMLPLAEQECATIWTASLQEAAELMSLDDAAFVARLQKTFGYRLGRFQGIRARHTFPLSMVTAKEAVFDRVLLLGNAAHTLHPIAAQGFNLALYEVAAIVSGILSASDRGVNTDSLLSTNMFYADIQQFSQETKQQQSISINFSHRLAKLLAGSTFIHTSLLQLGMVGLDLVRPAKRKLLEQLMGRAGRMPHLLMSSIELLMSN